LLVDEHRESTIAFLKRTGTKYKVRGKEARIDCPFCDESTGFDLNIITGLWRCKRAGCDRRGNLHQLKVAMGAAYSVDTIKHTLKRPQPQPKGLQPVGWPGLLAKHPRADRARQWLTERGFTSELIDCACLGWIPRHPSSKRKGVVRNGMISIPYYSAGAATLGTIMMHKLRWVPPYSDDPPKYMRIAGQNSWIYTIHLDTSKPLLLVGGELDALSVYQAMMTDSELHPDNLPFCVASMPDGEGSVCDSAIPLLERFERIVIAYDNDHAGKAGAIKVSNRLGRSRCSIANGWPSADANQSLIDGRLSRVFLMDMMNNAKPIAADNVSTAVSIADEMIGGFRDGEVTLITGHSGAGKTTLACQALLHQRLELKRKTLICPFEGGARLVVPRILWQLAEQDPAQLKAEQIRQHLYRLGEDFYIFRHVGAVDPDMFNETLIYCLTVLGIQFIDVDVLQFMTRRGSDKRWDLQDQIVMNSKTAVSEYGAHMLLVSHPKALGNRGSKDDQIVQLVDQKGHTEVFQDCDNCLSIYRPREIDRQANLDKDGYSNAAVISLKQRSNYGSEGCVELKYDTRSSQFLSTKQTGQPAWLP
jgi:hypothetical protein